MIAESGFAGPMQLHISYPLGGAEDGKTTLPREQVQASIKRDLDTLRGYMSRG